MWYRDKTFWRNLLITAVILGSVYTCTAYFAIQDRERQEEIHKQGEEVYGRMRRAVDRMAKIMTLMMTLISMTWCQAKNMMKNL